MPEPTPLLLHRRDPARNMARFYRLSLEPNLFGGVSLVRNWGRIGAAGRLRIDLHPCEATADRCRSEIAVRKRRRGYTEPA
jgi:predicted DNA-binding WGR domain protein